MRHALSRSLAALLALAALSPLWVASAQAARADAQHRGASRAIPTSTASEFVVGKTVYLRSTGTRIGVIEKIDPAHDFPPWMSRTPLRAVLIHRKDGPMDWAPLDRVTRIYVVDR